jgi:hypothetical protein
MILTTEFYNNLIGYAHALIIKNNSRCNVDKYDVVHTVICTEYETLEEYKSAIYGEIKKGMAIRNEVSFTDYSSTNKVYIQYRTCKYCGETMSEEYFKTGFSNTHNMILYRNKCKFCHYKTRKKYKISEDSKIKSVSRVRERRAKERLVYGKIIDPTRNERVKRFRQKERLELSDGYIVRLLTRYKYKKEDITKAMIEDRRVVVMQKRQLKNKDFAVL